MTAKPGEGAAFNFNLSGRFAFAEAAAEEVTREQLIALFEKLNAADEQFPENASASVIAASRAVADFLCAQPQNRNGYYSRPFELLVAELRGRTPANKRRIFPAYGSGSGGVNASLRDHYIKAAAAFAVEFLHMRTGLPAKAAENEIAEALTAHGFPFSAKRAPAIVVKVWLRECRKSGNKSKVAQYFHAYRANPPIPFTGKRDKDRAAIRRWFSKLVARAGYGVAV